MFYFYRGSYIPFAPSPIRYLRSYITGTSYTEVFSKISWTTSRTLWYIIRNEDHKDYMDVLIGPTEDTLEVIHEIQTYIKISKWEI